MLLSLPLSATSLNNDKLLKLDIFLMDSAIDFTIILFACSVVRLTISSYAFSNAYAVKSVDSCRISSTLRVSPVSIFSSISFNTIILLINALPINKIADL